MIIYLLASNLKNAKLGYFGIKDPSAKATVKHNASTQNKMFIFYQ